ncbi:hypothetical protein [Kitasatospora sp. NPDC050543]|uniref:hypothetical protein n=1 Tax=Kitasatospora sp. NPDC050543 TaxID=3364054 RepID=UPI00378C302D
MVLRSYQDWWQARIGAYAHPAADTGILAGRSAGQAQAEALTNLHRLIEANLVMSGSPRNSAVVKSLDLRAAPRTAEIEDCVDITDWHQVDAKTGALKDPEQRLTRYVLSVALREDNNGWLVTRSNRLTEKTC